MRSERAAREAVLTSLNASRVVLNIGAAQFIYCGLTYPQLTNYTFPKQAGGMSAIPLRA